MPRTQQALNMRIKNRKKCEERRRSQLQVSDSTVSAQRRAAVDKSKPKVEQLKALFASYDTNKTGVLELDQVVDVLTALDNGTPAGTPPGDDEVATIMALADADFTGSLNWKEFQQAIVAWDHYIANRERLAATLKRFDADKSKSLDKEELAVYLTELNGGEDIPAAEVQWVFASADVSGDGQLDQMELGIATSIWYTKVQPSARRNGSGPEKRGSCCCGIATP